MEIHFQKVKEEDQKECHMAGKFGVTVVSTPIGMVITSLNYFSFYDVIWRLQLSENGGR